MVSAQWFVRTQGELSCALCALWCAVLCLTAEYVL
jgi:hypothetical protein